MPGETCGQQGKVILIAPQSSPAAILKPRLEAAGGDPAQVMLLNTIESLDTRRTTLHDRPFSLPTDLPTLAASITRHNAQLVIIDPLATVLRASQSTDVTLLQLAQLAEQTGCAILLVRHLTSRQAASSLIQDASLLGLTAIVPTILRLIRHPYDDQQHLLLSRMTEYPNPTKSSDPPAATTSPPTPIPPPKTSHPTADTTRNRITHSPPRYNRHN